MTFTKWQTLTRNHWVVVVCATGAILACLEESWYYVANVMILSETTRTPWKTWLFWPGVALVLSVNVIAAIDSKGRWIRQVAVVMGSIFLIRSILMGGYEFVSGTHTPTRGYPFPPVVGWVIGSVLATAVAAFGSVLLGAVVRIMVSRPVFLDHTQVTSTITR